MNPRLLRPLAMLSLSLAAAGAVAAAEGQAASPWQHAGRLGLVQYLIVPEAAARDPGIYDRAVAELCEQRASCFMRFFTNSTGVAVSLPLPDAIASEPTVIYQRSDKQSVAALRWSCRLKLPGPCF